MKLEEIVPSLEMCQQIPQGAFAESALVWVFDGDLWHVEERETSFYKPEEMIPAPTLTEIIAELPPVVKYKGEDFFLTLDDFRNINRVWRIRYCKYGVFCLHKEDENLITAALKLWLKVKGWKK